MATRRKHQLKEKVPQLLRGPRSFNLNRLLAIFFSIRDAPVEMTAELQVQVTSLVSLGLLRRLGSRLEDPKYKCLISRELATKIGRSVGFALHHYLFEEA